MNEHRKEHSMVAVQNVIYVIGGYNPPSNLFLKSCERYNVVKDEWQYVCDMN